MLDAFTLHSRGKTMVCLMDYKDEATKGKTVVLYKHGFMGNKITPHRMIVNFAHQLAEAGITTIRFDCAGAGDSEGDCHLTTIPGEIEDTRVVLRYIKEQVRPERFILLGYSMGGVVASILSAQADVDGLLLWSPVSAPYENFQHLLGVERFAQGLAGSDVDFGGDRVGKEFFLGLDDPAIDPLNALKNFTKPVYIIHGTGDTDVLPAGSLSYVNIAPNAKRETVAGATHGYDNVSQQEELFRLSFGFLKEIWNLN